MSWFSTLWRLERLEQEHARMSKELEHLKSAVAAMQTAVADAAKEIRALATAIATNETSDMDALASQLDTMANVLEDAVKNPAPAAPVA